MRKRKIGPLPVQRTDICFSPKNRERVLYGAFRQGRHGGFPSPPQISAQKPLRPHAGQVSLRAVGL